ncbi:hypothetical protein O9993_01660 [Vibrio lentus]|nr:hypothetical protein [Vibrio lentus]
MKSTTRTGCRAFRDAPLFTDLRSLLKNPEAVVTIVLQKMQVVVHPMVFDSKKDFEPYYPCRRL